MQVVTAFVDGGVAFAETLEAARGQSLKMAEVRACQHAAKTAFRQVALILLHFSDFNLSEGCFYNKYVMLYGF